MSLGSDGRGAVRRGVCALVGWGALAVLGAAQERLAPGDAWTKFALDPDFRIDLVASEPTVVAPSAVAWDARERMWVCSGGERLLILPRLAATPTPETASRAPIVFASGLEHATSFVLHDGGALVADARGITWLRDTDGDDRADAHELVLPGLAPVRCMRRSLDGFVLAALGRPDGVDALAPAGLVRFRPDGSELESVVALEAPLFGFDTSWDGELFLATGATHAAHVVLPDAAFSSGRVGGVASWIDMTDHAFVERLKGAALVGQAFTVPGDVAVYAGGRWPAAFDGNLFTSEPRGGLVHRDRVEASGVSFRAGRIGAHEFLASRDALFRPTTLAAGPDGALYVLDRYADADDAGRIWRIDASSVRAPAVGAPPLATEAAFAQPEVALSAPNRWMRMTMHRLLGERGMSAAARTRLAQAARESTVAALSVHAVWLAHADIDLVRAALSHYRPEVRRNALEVVRTVEVNSRRISSADVRGHALDGGARSQLEALRAWATRIDGPSHRDLVELYPRLEDDWSRSLALAIAGVHPATFLSVALKRGQEADCYELARLLALDVGRRASLRDAVAIVLALREENASPRVVAVVLRTLHAEFAASEAPWPSPRLASTLRHLSSEESLTIASAALPLARLWLGDQLALREVDAWSDRLHTVALDPERSLEVRLNGIDALLAVPEARARAIEAADRMLASAGPAAAKLRVVNALGAQSGIEAAQALVHAFPLVQDEARDRAFDVLFARADWTAVLLDAVEAGRVSREQLGDERAARLCAHPDSAIATRAARL